VPIGEGSSANGASPWGSKDATIVVLGCRPLWTGDGRLCGALGRRVGAASSAASGGSGFIVVSGGRSWDGVLEADAMRDELVAAGVAPCRIVRERCSLTTEDNARLTAALLERFGVTRVTLATCEWHMPRARALFERQGVLVDPLFVPSPEVRQWERVLRGAREWASLRYWSHKRGSA
jgi:uncharacterized SAM-binding protein YcdF (DUF218 family)